MKCSIYLCVKQSSYQLRWKCRGGVHTTRCFIPCLPRFDMYEFPCLYKLTTYQSMKQLCTLLDFNHVAYTCLHPKMICISPQVKERRTYCMHQPFMLYASTFLCCMHQPFYADGKFIRQSQRRLHS